MSSTEFNVGLTDENKSSSRVLKPPGGGHSDIFGSPSVKANPPRPKYNQQNSSNMNCVMGTTDPNLLIGQESHEPQKRHFASAQESGDSNSSDKQDSGRSRVPPGGFSSGFW